MIGMVLIGSQRPRTPKVDGKPRFLFTAKTLVLGVLLEETQLKHDPKFDGNMVKMMETHFEHDGNFFGSFF